jgi:hypothetical protein
MSYAEDIAERFPDDRIPQLDGFDDCIIGHTDAPALVYSIPKMLEQLGHEMDEDDALDHFGYNIERTVEAANLSCILVWTR